MKKNNKNIANSTQKDELIRKEIKELISRIEPCSEVYLFGSRTRGTNKRNSDWDLLILLDGKVDLKRQEKIIDELFDIKLEKRIVFNSIIRNKDIWRNDELMHFTPFYKNVEIDKVAL